MYSFEPPVYLSNFALKHEKIFSIFSSKNYQLLQPSISYYIASEKHYENIPMQYTAFKGCKNDQFLLEKKKLIFSFLLETYIVTVHNM